jgi:putative membrane protein
MYRRLAFGVLAAPLVIRPTLAQNQAGQGVVSAQPPPDNQTQMMMLGGMAFALGTAQLAERMGESPAVKTFGQLEAEEQTAFMTARQQAGLRVPTVELMTEEKRQLMIRMREMRGAEFDRAFVQAQIQGHHELLQLHQAAAQTPTSREEGMLATVAVPAIRTHLVMLQAVQQSMRG